MLATLLSLGSVFLIPLFVDLYDGPFNPLTVLTIRHFIAYGLVAFIAFFYNLTQCNKSDGQIIHTGLKKGLIVAALTLLAVYFVSHNSTARIPFTIILGIANIPRLVDCLVMLCSFLLSYGASTVVFGTC